VESHRGQETPLVLEIGGLSVYMAVCTMTV
jgi:hypothetical protein